ncbi:hypothetical protein V8C86DRAFT_2444237 [Haematococcus lacustris]
MSSRAALGDTGGTGGFFGAGGIGCGYIIGGSAIRAPAAPRCPWAGERRRGRRNTTTSGRSSAAGAMAATRLGIRFAGRARASAVADPSSRLASMARIRGGGDGAAPVMSSSPDWEVVKWVDPALAMPEQQPGSLVGAASWARRHDERRSIPTAPDGRWAVAAIAPAVGDLPLVVVFIRLVEEGGPGARSNEEPSTTPTPREAPPPAPLGPAATRVRRPPRPRPGRPQSRPLSPAAPTALSPAPYLHPRRRSPAHGQRGAAGARIAAPPMTQHPPMPPAPMQPPVPPVPQPVPPVPQPVPPVPQPVPPVPQHPPVPLKKPLVPPVPPNAALLDMFWDDIDGIDVGILGGLFLV